MSDYSLGYANLKSLQELLAPEKSDSEPEDDLPQAGARKLGKTLYIHLKYFN